MFAQTAENNYQKGLEYYNQGDYNNAFPLFKKAANLGYASAQNALGVMYREGKGVAQNYEEALRWYRKAANQGDAMAQNSIGVMYRRGICVPQNDVEAVTWYYKSADQGYAVAQSNLGIMYENGLGVTKNYAEAIKWYRKSAEQGHYLGQYHLGNCYYNGQGVAKDYNEAAILFRKAADQGYSNAMNDLGFCYANGYGVPQDLQIAKAWYQKALNADSNNTLARDNLAKLETKSAGQPSSATNVTPNVTPNVVPVVEQAILSPVDKDIPKTKKVNENTYAVIIGNEQYKYEANVPYAENDARVFREYVQKTLGVPEKHIKFALNVGLNDLGDAIDWLKQAMDVCDGNGKIIFYYAGHGIPNEEDKSAILLPIDGRGSRPRSGFPLKWLYKILGNMSAQQTLVFLDACFSGAKREGGMMNEARGVTIKAKPADPEGNLVVFSAAQGDETAYPYKANQHGMFTYYLLKKIQEKKGNVTLGELSDDVIRDVKRHSFEENNKKQTPTVTPSPAIKDKWRDMKLK